MKMRNVYSSHVDQIGYDAATKELHVQYSKGQYSVYKDVPPDKANLVLTSPSIGQALHQYIKNQHDHEYRE